MKQAGASDRVWEDAASATGHMLGPVGAVAIIISFAIVFLLANRRLLFLVRGSAVLVLTLCLATGAILGAFADWASFGLGKTVFSVTILSSAGLGLIFWRLGARRDAPQDSGSGEIHRLAAVLSRDSDLCWYFETDKSGLIRSASKGLSALVVQGKDPLHGRTFSDLFASTDTGGGWQRFLLALESQSAVDCTVEIRPNNMSGWWKIRSRPQFSEDGTFAGHLGIAFNVTSERQAYGDLAADHRKLTIEAESRATLLDDLAQQLRAPLNTILGFAELLGSEAGSARQEAERRAHVEMLLDTSKDLSIFINDISDFARADRGSLHLLEHEIDAAELVETAVKHCHDAAETADVNIIANIVDGIELRCDAVRICRVVVTLVSQALKASPHAGTVQVSFARTADFGLAVVIHDDGMWLGHDEEHNPFEPDIQKHGMQALALPIARRIAMLHGGDVTVEGAAAAGTTRRLVIPPHRVTWSDAESCQANRAA